jgi:hypothetical protein
MQTAIAPVIVYPGNANTLYIRSIGLGPPPSYYYELQQVTVTPAIDEQRDPTDNSIIVAAQPAQTSVVVLKNGNVNMPQEDWNNWTAGLGPDGDTEYQLFSISTALGLIRV